MRLIDADALIEFIENRYEITWDSGTYEGGIKDACSDILEKIDNMENIKPETNSSESPNGWTPCSIKKHPDSKIECYVTVKDYTDDYEEEYDLIVDVDTYYPEHDAWDNYCDLDVIAWMPKNEPKEPYQPKEDEL